MMTVVEKIRHFQRVPYEFPFIAFVSNFLRNVRYASEEENYQLSKALEPTDDSRISEAEVEPESEVLFVD